MHLKAISQSRLCWLWLGLAVFPAALGAQQTPQSQDSQQTPQSRLPVGFPGYRGGVPNRPGRFNNPNPNANPAPVPPPAAKPSPAVPASQLPPMPVAQPTPPPAPQPTPQKPAQRATVQYENGLLTIKASNSSMNQILRAIMRETGLQITGGVTEERVYGSYGPAPLQTLLANLLVGTGANILYVSARNDQPAQLTLTPRNGGPPPPPPSVSASDDLIPDVAPVQDLPVAMQPNLSPQTTGPAVGSVPATPPMPAPAALAAPAAPATAVAAGTPAANPAAPAGNTGKPHTPEEIVQQILQLRAAQKKMLPDGTTPAPAATPVTPAPVAAPK